MTCWRKYSSARKRPQCRLEFIGFGTNLFSGMFILNASREPPNIVQRCA
jgi:hypothetical protein